MNKIKRIPEYIYQEDDINVEVYSSVEPKKSIEVRSCNNIHNWINENNKHGKLKATMGNKVQDERTGETIKTLKTKGQTVIGLSNKAEQYAKYAIKNNLGTKDQINFLKTLLNIRGDNNYLPKNVSYKILNLCESIRRKQFRKKYY